MIQLEAPAYPIRPDWNWPLGPVRIWRPLVQPTEMRATEQGDRQPRGVRGPGARDYQIGSFHGASAPWDGEEKVMAQSFHDSLINFGAPKKSSFNRKLGNGTSIFSPKGWDKPNKSQYHGHRGPNFYRSPHSTLGAAAIGRPHTYGPKNGRPGHHTHRW
jgi:hypothetical protein